MRRRDTNTLVVATVIETESVQGLRALFKYLYKMKTVAVLLRAAGLCDYAAECHIKHSKTILQFKESIICISFSSLPVCPSSCNSSSTKVEFAPPYHLGISRKTPMILYTRQKRWHHERPFQFYFLQQEDGLLGFTGPFGSTSRSMNSPTSGSAAKG